MLQRLKSIQNIYVPVRNIDKSKQWYQEKLGLEVKKESDATVDLQVYKGDTLLTLVQTDDFKPVQYLDKDYITPYYNLNTLHAEKCHLRLQTYDVRVTDILELEMIKCFNLFDPDENVIGVCYEKEDSLYYEHTDEYLPPLFERVEAVFIPVIDLNRALNWYVNCLGMKLHINWKKGADLGFSDGRTLVTLLHTDDFKPLSPLSKTNGKSYFSFKTKNIQHTHSYLKKQQVTVSNIVQNESTASCQVVDSEGNSLEIIYQKEKEVSKHDSESTRYSSHSDTCTQIMRSLSLGIEMH